MGSGLRAFSFKRAERTPEESALRQSYKDIGSCVSNAYILLKSSMSPVYELRIYHAEGKYIFRQAGQEPSNVWEYLFTVRRD